MRWADFGPTPGSTRRASISCSSSADDTSERQLHPGRQRQAGGGRAHLLLRGRVDLVDRVVEGRGDQVLGHLRVGEHARVDAHAAAFHAPAQGDVHHAAPGVAGDLEVGEFFLGALHLFLHLLRLLHELGDVSAHLLHLLSCGGQSSWGRIESGTTVAPWRCISRRTPGSARKPASAASWRASRSRSLRWWRVSPPAGATSSNFTCTLPPSAGANAASSARTDFLSSASSGGSASRSTPSAWPTNTACAASCRAGPARSESRTSAIQPS